MSEQPLVNIVCLKWGTRYPASFTNILYASVKRHLHRPFRFVCFTDDPTGLVEGVETQPFPALPDERVLRAGNWWPNIFVKLCLFQDGLANLVGPTLFFDVDVVIQQDIDCFFDYMPGKNVIIHNWVELRKKILHGRPNIGNSSCFRFEAGKSNYIYQTFLDEVEQAVDRKFYTTEQAFMTHAMKEVYWWPEEWVRSFKRTCVLPFPFNFIFTPKKPNTKVLVFHGNPDPDKAAEGFKGKKLHHHTRPCPWILEDWHE